MAFDPHALLALDIPATTARYDWRDAALYALGTGAGMDPLDPVALRLLDGPGLAVLPSFATVLGYQGFWIEQQRTGIDVTQVLHVGQGLRLAGPLAASGHIRRTTRVTGVVDRGAGRGSLVFVEEQIDDVETGAGLATLWSTILCRAEGGHGSTRAPAEALPRMPDRAPDASHMIAGSPQQALIYRLSGDLNPLHSDPAAAHAAGLDRPILHGLAAYGTACRVLLAGPCDGNTNEMSELEARFTAPTFPGEPLELQIWRLAPRRATFRLVAPHRAAVILDHGRFTLGSPS